MTQIVRLRGITAPPITEPTVDQGERSKRRLIELIDQADGDLCCITHENESDPNAELTASLYPHAKAFRSFNEILVAEGLAVPTT